MFNVTMRRFRKITGCRGEATVNLKYFCVSVCEYVRAHAWCVCGWVHGRWRVLARV